jgi:hypothetical protein
MKSVIFFDVDFLGAPHGNTRGGGYTTPCLERPGGRTTGGERRKEETERYHTPADPKGSADDGKRF